MPSKIFSYNRSLFVQNVRNIGWIGIVHLLLLFAAIPLRILMIYTNQKRDYSPVFHNVFEFSNVFQGMIAFTVPVLLAIFLFRYMQMKRSADYMHSLPLRRETLFFQQMTFGALMLVIPVLATVLLTALLCQLPLENMHISAADLVRWTAEMLLMELFVFSASVWVGMFTGISVLQGAFAYILFLFPAGISVLILMNMRYVLSGFAADYYLSANLERIVPFFRFVELADKPLASFEMARYALAIVVCYLLSIWLYKQRHSEAAGQAIAFPVLQPVFSFGVTFCFMLVGGLYFGETQRSLGWILFGYVTFSLVGFFIASAIIEKTWRIFHRWKEYAVFIVAIVVIGSLVRFDITGYEKRQPALSDIQRVYFGESVYQFERQTEKQYISYVQSDQFLQTTQNIKNVYAFHRQLIEDRPTSFAFGENTRQVVIGYVLKNGEKMVRMYSIPINEYKPFYEAIMESREYKHNYYLLLQDNVSPIRQITLRAEEKTVQIADPKQIESFIAVLKTELKEEPFTEMISPTNDWGTIELLQGDGDQMQLSWKKSYARIDAWLKQHDLLSKARITADDIQYAIVVKNDARTPLYNLVENPTFVKELETRTDVLRITDKKQLEECLQKASSYKTESRYIIAFYRTAHAEPEWHVIDEEALPSFIREQLP
ncbi:DUF6449 domain-containing protein [Anoxybacteroides amylolyticum]|uniref:Putative membrane protein n=1 Tax=Anoxybacteroides amylolyticum TaxID=294699 RepID=A0A160F744_9BACL|nr:DUF6449 domain-containing protein [Anoxybacillus amylolyticus]ANB61783.1 putative membrane protein [Anoxybacillus amylolyticus]